MLRASCLLPAWPLLIKRRLESCRHFEIFTTIKKKKKKKKIIGMTNISPSVIAGFDMQMKNIHISHEQLLCIIQLFRFMFSSFPMKYYNIINSITLFKRFKLNNSSIRLRYYNIYLINSIILNNSAISIDSSSI